MKLFNLDLHISVIADIAHVLKQLGHSVTDWSLSGHSWVFGRSPDRVDGINPSNWDQIGPEMADRFYERYKDELSQYDAFIVTHTPCFAMLYERFEKPVIVVASTRYEHPFHDATRWQAFNDYLRRQIDSGKIIPIANDRYDAAYAEYFTNRKWEVIPSLCAYTGAQYSGWRSEYLLASKFKGVPPIRGLVPKERVLQPGYTWQMLAEYRGIVQIPYNSTTMSLFEQYTANVPLFFPSLDLLKSLYSAHRDEGVLSEISWNLVKGLPPGSSVPTTGENDPNRYNDVDVMMGWMRLSCCYDPEVMPHITYFDSFEDLEDILRDCDTQAVSEKMKLFNAERKKEVTTKWALAMNKICPAGGLA